jgi:uncharacterized protein (DUF924 family)
MIEANSVLDFWFGASGADGSLDPARKKMWFGDGRKYDAEIQQKFGMLHERASRGELDADGAATPCGRMALIILLDQMSRHIHRDTPRAFAQDPVAQKLALDGINHKMDRDLIPAQRAFFYLPFEHAEDIGMQRVSLRCFDALARAAAPAFKKDYDSFYDYGRRHHDIIERFGRFPHRNAILGRASTPEEIEFLKQPGSSF